MKLIVILYTILCLFIIFVVFRYYFRKFHNVTHNNLIYQFVINLQQSGPLCDIDEKCVKPSSKSGQDIQICQSNVYKGPPSKHKPYVKINHINSTIEVDAYTMNILVQTAIKNCNVDKVEQYNTICQAEYSHYMQTKKMSLDYHCYRNKCRRINQVHSVQDYIKLLNQTKSDGYGYLINWINSMINTLDELYNKIQFHHCDPKAAQLFTDDQNLVVGDLDKVTFSLGILNSTGQVKMYRVHLRTSWKSTIIGLFGSKAEQMRYEHFARSNNLFEKCAFICSILLLLDQHVKTSFINDMKKQPKLNYLLNHVDFHMINTIVHKYPLFKDRTSHKLACKCVKDMTHQFIPINSEFIIMDKN